MAKVLAKTKDMPLEEWRALRRKSIGGSDAAAIIGLNPYCSAFTLYCDKKGMLPEKEDTEAMRIGRDLEEYVARRFTEATGKKARNDYKMYLHCDYPFISANVDRLIVGEKAGLECKTTSAFAKSDFENGEIPQYYYVQCMHYMNVLGLNKMYLAVLVMGRAFYWFEILRDEEEIQALERAEVAFWKNHIEQDVPPDVDGSESTSETIRTIFPESTDDMAVYVGDDLALLAAKKEEIKALKEIENEIQNRIIATMGEHCNAVSERYKATYKTQSSMKFDTKTFKNDYPELYKEYAKETTSRVFRMKEVKK